MQYRGGTLIAVHNLSDKRAEVKLEVSDYQGRRLVDLIDNSEREPVEGQRHELALEPYGFHWFRVT